MIVYQRLTELDISAGQHCSLTVRDASGYTLFSKLWDVASSVGGKVANIRDPIDFVLDTTFDQLQVVVDYKARVAQAKHFLGDTFAERFGSYIREQEKVDSAFGISASEIVDSNKYVKETTDWAADKIVGDVVIKVETTALKTFLPSPFDVVGCLLENENVLYYARTYLGTGLAYILFPQGAFAMAVVALLPYISKNLWVFQTGFREASQMVRLMRAGAIPLAATELIDANIPPFILADFVMRNRAILANNRWPKDALVKMTNTIPMPLFVDYFSVLIQHFPEFLSGPQSIVSSGYGWIFSKPSDQILRFSDLVGMFRLPTPANKEAFTNFIQAMEPETKSVASQLDEMTLVIIDYYLMQLNVVQSLTSPSDERTKDMNRMCQVITKMFLSFDETIEFVIKSGLIALTALAARFLPLHDVKVRRAGLDLLKFAIREGKPLSVLTVMRNVVIPKNYPLEQLKPKDEAKDGASRSRRLLFEAFSLLRHSKNHTRLLCRNSLYPRASGFAYLYNFPINLSFLPKPSDPPMTEEEIKYVSAAVTNLVFDIPLNEGIELKKVGSTVIETVNLLIANHCGFFRDRLIKATTVQHSTAPKHNRPLSPRKLEFKSKPSQLSLPEE